MCWNYCLLCGFVSVTHCRRLGVGGGQYTQAMMCGHILLETQVCASITVVIIGAFYDQEALHPLVVILLMSP
jgi:hypothetical protein